MNKCIVCGKIISTTRPHISLEDSGMRKYWCSSACFNGEQYELPLLHPPRTLKPPLVEVDSEPTRSECDF